MPHTDTPSDQPDHTEKRRARKRELSQATLDLRRRLGDNTPTSTTPQALYHWTLADQLEDLEKARAAEPELGFMMRLLALCTLPRTNPGARTQYVRRNGPLLLSMTATGTPAKLPFGNIPRLLLAWVCTEAVRTQSRTLKDFYNEIVNCPVPLADKKTIDNFRTQVLRELAKLKDAWPQLDYRTPPGCLELHPTPPRIAPVRRDRDDG